VPTAGQAAAICYLAVAVCAGGFYLLYSALPRPGAERVGLFAGLVPFGALGAALLLGAGTIRLADVAGAVIVAAGTGTRRTRQLGTRQLGTRQWEKEDTAAAPQQSRTRTGAPRA
jgi:drug/metabolite transporter (DMT)-like permease